MADPRPDAVSSIIAHPSCWNFNRAMACVKLEALLDKHASADVFAMSKDNDMIKFT